MGVEKSTVATWLRSAGYKTVLIGKYLNGYPSAASGWNYLPPGWSEWYGNQGGLQFNYTLVENGKIVHYGTAAKDYMQDVLRRRPSTSSGACSERRSGAVLHVAGHIFTARAGSVRATPRWRVSGCESAENPDF